jgi:hypothetical protein
MACAFSPHFPARGSVFISLVTCTQTAGLETKLFYSTQRDECYCKVRCPPSRMEWMATFLEYKLKLDSVSVRPSLFRMCAACGKL